MRAIAPAGPRAAPAGLRAPRIGRRRGAPLPAPRRGRPLLPPAASTTASPDTAALMTWLVEAQGLPPPAAEPDADGALTAARAVAPGEVWKRGE
jgi:hypothetical protein